MIIKEKHEINLLELLQGVWSGNIKKGLYADTTEETSVAITESIAEFRSNNNTDEIKFTKNTKFIIEKEIDIDENTTLPMIIVTHKNPFTQEHRTSIVYDAKIKNIIPDENIISLHTKSYDKENKSDFIKIWDKNWN